MTLHPNPPEIRELSNRSKDEPGGLGSAPDDQHQRLVLVSNRVADLAASEQSGGLAVGVSDAITERGGLWFGWDGKRNGHTGNSAEISQHGKVTRVGIPVSPEDFRDYYVEYSNSVLWPLFHYRPDLVNIKPSAFEGYMRVNEAFARQLLPMLRPNDLIWVHDYHLIPLAHILRRLGCGQRIGHFLHIPFPSPELLSATPDHAVQRWSQKFGPVVKVDRMTRETIQNDKEKDAYA
ncbi:trehalose-6-phosphate synthase [Roseovarius sp. MBR-154]|jgi:trehalose 6-phosphate synthase